MAEQLCCAERLSWQNPVMKKLVIRSLAATSGPCVGAMMYLISTSHATDIHFV